MFTDEVVVLMAIDEAGESIKKPKSVPKSITGSHIGYLCNSLVRHGYLAVHSLAKHKLTSKGRDAILREAVLLVNCGDRVRAKDRMQRLEWLYDEISQHIDNFGEKSVKIYLDKEPSVLLMKTTDEYS